MPQSAILFRRVRVCTACDGVGGCISSHKQAVRRVLRSGTPALGAHTGHTDGTLNAPPHHGGGEGRASPRGGTSRGPSLGSRAGGKARTHQPRPIQLERSHVVCARSAWQFFFFLAFVSAFDGAGASAFAADAILIIFERRLGKACRRLGKARESSRKPKMVRESLRRPEKT